MPFDKLTYSAFHKTKLSQHEYDIGEDNGETQNDHWRIRQNGLGGDVIEASRNVNKGFNMICVIGR